MRFRLSFNSYSTWLGVCQWSADLQIPSPRNSASVGFVEKWVRANDMHCTCARRTGLQLHGLFLVGHILPELRKFICAMKL